MPHDYGGLNSVAKIVVKVATECTYTVVFESTGLDIILFFISVHTSAVILSSLFFAGLTFISIVTLPSAPSNHHAVFFRSMISTTTLPMIHAGTTTWHSQQQQLVHRNASDSTLTCTHQSMTVAREGQSHQPNDCPPVLSPPREVHLLALLGERRRIPKHCKRKQSVSKQANQSRPG